MLKFIDKNDYQLITATFVDSETIRWEYVEGGTTHSGVFKDGTASNHERDGTEFFPFVEVQVETTVNPKPQSEIDAEAAVQAAQAKIAADNALTVTVDGMVFQANERSRGRMGAAIIAAEELGLTTHDWKLADNSVVSITLAQLKQAHAAAIQAFGAIILN